jgi:transcriptional regulator with XRE-family HTH domain
MTTTADGAVMAGANEFGELLRQMRLAKGWTQKELAEKIGVTNHTIAKYESGARKPPSRHDSRDQVVRMSQVLGDKEGRLAELAGHTPRPDLKIKEIRTRPPFRDLILTEPSLTSDQKRILVSLYDSWVGGS